MKVIKKHKSRRAPSAKAVLDILNVRGPSTCYQVGQSLTPKVTGSIVAFTMTRLKNRKQVYTEYAGPTSSPAYWTLQKPPANWKPNERTRSSKSQLRAMFPESIDTTGFVMVVKETTVPPYRRHDILDMMLYVVSDNGAELDVQWMDATPDTALRYSLLRQATMAEIEEAQEVMPAAEWVDTLEQAKKHAKE